VRWRRELIGMLAASLACWTAEAAAQGTERMPRFEVGGGVLWAFSTSFGSKDANFTTPAGGPYALFSTSSELASVDGAEVTAGVRMSRRIEAEVALSYSTPELRTSIANDAEGANSLTASESIRQFTIGGAAVIDLKPLKPGSNVVPFVRAGASYLRQLHESQTLVETGQEYDVGGGVRFPLKAAGLSRAPTRVGVRLEGRATIRAGGIALDGGTHTSPAVAASIFARF